jgi:hypothetical protein
VAIPHFRVVAAVPVVFTSSLVLPCSIASPLSISRPLLLLAPMRVVERIVDLSSGLYANDKFCFTRRGKLTLSRPRFKLCASCRRRKESTLSPTYPPRKAIRHGGIHETPVVCTSGDCGAPGRKAALGPGLPEHPAVDPRVRTDIGSERKR